jgi:hypothetical protein
MARPRSGPRKRTRTLSAPASAEPAPAPAPAPAPLNDHPRAGVEAPGTERSKLVDELERDLDRILFRVMGAGDLPELEHQLRLCRRLLILGMGSPE